MTTRITVQGVDLELIEIAITIRARPTRTDDAISQDLIRARSLCRHGQWQTFLDAAGIPYRTAY